MYNGIGLATVRGSGTNGYVTKNMSHVSRSRIAERKDGNKPQKFGMAAPRAPNMEIIEHNRKREVELKVMRLRDSLEEEGVAPSTIEEKCTALRTSLLAKLPSPSAGGAGASKPGETHSDAATKQAENEALKSALGISSGYVGGSAFDRELQERQRQERIAKREAEEAEVAEMEAALEREKEREEKRKRKEARALEKDEKKKAKKEKRNRE